MSHIRLDYKEPFSSPIPLTEPLFSTKCVDKMIRVTYIFRYLHFQISVSSPSTKEIFEGKIIQRTHNYAKFSELPKYIQFFRSSNSCVDYLEDQFKNKGIGLDNKHPYPKPFKGLCTGSGILFFQKWFELRDIQKVAKIFEGGVPIEGAAYQEIYATLKVTYYPRLVEKIEELIQNYPKSFVLEEKLKRFETLFKMVEEYLKEGNQFENKDFFNWAKEKKLTLTRKQYATLQEVQERQCQMPLAQMNLETTIFSLARLNAEVIHFDSPPEEILQSVSTLTPGGYKLALPVLSKHGALLGRHSLGLIILESDQVHLFDPKCCLASFSKDKLQKTVGRLFTAYTHFDYSHDLKGEALDNRMRFLRCLWKKPHSLNPPLSSGFDLLKITN